jgi:hypothetical protein
VVGLEDGGHLSAAVLAGGEHVVAEAVAVFEQHQLFAEEIEAVLVEWSGETVVFGGDEDERVSKESAADDVAMMQRKRDDDEVEFGGLQAVDEALGDVFGEADINVGVLLLESRQIGCNEVREDCGNDADAEGTADIGGELADLRGGLFGLTENLLRERIEAIASMGEADGSSLPGEELGTEGEFEAADLLRERRLRDADLLGCFGEAAGLDDSAEVAELVEFHRGRQRESGGRKQVGCEEVESAAGDEFGGDRLTEFAGGYADGGSVDDVGDGFAVGCGDHGVEVPMVVYGVAERTERKLAASAESGEDEALGLGGELGFRAVQSVDGVVDEGVAAIVEKQVLRFAQDGSF